jgi:hypothetical protein
MMMFCGRRVYIFAAVMLVVVGAVHRSCVVRWTRAVGVREGDFPAVRMFVGWSHNDFWKYVGVFNRRISV